MIPKIIHYCWFGGNPLPKLAKKCIKSWKKFCSDYEIIEWNENNYDISSAPLYVRQAYDAKKWAFVTDYVRLQVVYENGGIYLDTDVEIIKPIDNFLCYDAYFGFQNDNYIATGLGFGAVKNADILYNMMADYKDIPFIKADGSFDLTTCPKRNLHIFNEYGFNLNGEDQEINHIAVFSADYFCPMNGWTGEVLLTNNSHTIHHFSASWYSKQDKKNLVENRKKDRKLKRYYKTCTLIKKILGEKLYNKIKRIFKK